MAIQMPSETLSDAWLPSVSSQVRFSTGPQSELAWLLYKCAVFWMAMFLLQLKGPLELLVSAKRRELFPG